MDFYSAMQRVSSGGKVTREEWKNANIFVLLVNGMLSIHKEDGSFHQLLVSEGDMLGTDWAVVGNN